MTAAGGMRSSRGYAAVMPVDFEAAGLLDDLPDPCECAERIALLRYLLQRGVPLEDLRRAAAEGRLVLLAVGGALDATGEAYAPKDVAARTGLDVEAVRRLRASFGLASPPPRSALSATPTSRRRGTRRRRSRWGSPRSSSCA
jgi:hypothetical protein